MAQSRTRNRNSRSSNRNTETRSNDSVEVSFPRAFVNRVTAWFREREEIAALVGARIAATALAEARTAQSVGRTLGMELSFDLPANERRQRGRPPLATQPVAIANQQPQRQPQRQTSTRRRASSSSSRNRRGGGLDLANIGNGTTLADQVYRALPALGGSTTINDIARQCRTSRGTQPNNQAIGGVLNRFQNAGLINRQGEIVTTQRLARAA
jgi:hypothetical protein